MRIRKHSRITALVLALVMILPLISIPTFAEDATATTPLYWSENFDAATSVGDVLASYNAPSGMTTLVDGAIKRDYAAYDDGKLYLTTGQNYYYEISNPVLDGNTLVSGTTTISGVTYNLKGTVNRDVRVPSTKVTSMTATDGTAYSGNAWITDCLSSDAYKGGYNIGTVVNVKNPQVAKGSGKIYVSVDYFFSKDITDNATFEITAQPLKRGTPEADTKQKDNNRIDIAKLTVVNNATASYVYLEYHADTGISISGYKQVRSELGNWCTFTAVLDTTTGVIDLYLNGQHARSTLDCDLKEGIKANSFNVAQFSRGSTTQQPSLMVGYALVDNVVFDAAPDTYFVNDFEGYEGVAYSNFAANYATYTFNAASTNVEFETVNGNTYAKHNLSNDLDKDLANYGAENGLNDADGDGIVDYYAFIANTTTRWTKCKQIKSYDDSTKTLTMADGTTYTVSGSTNASLGYYGTFVDGDKTYTLCVPGYAINNKLNSTSIDKNPAIRMPYLSYEEYDKVYISFDYFLSEDAVGQAQGQFINVHSSTRHGKESEGKQNVANYWNEIFYVNASEAKLSLLNSSAIFNVPKGEWFEIGFMFDMKSGAVTMYVNGATQDKATTNFGENIIFSENTASKGNSWFNLAKVYKDTKNIFAQGYIAYDNFKVSPITSMETYLLNEDFNAFAYRDKPTASAGVTSIKGLACANSTIVDDGLGQGGSWRIDYNRADKTFEGHTTHGYNIDKSNTINNPAISYETNAEHVVFEVAYFIDANARGQIQSQFNPVTSNGTNYTWTDLYQIRFNTINNNPAAWLTREGGDKYGKAPIQTGIWNIISAVVNLKTGDVDYYINGVFAFDGNLNAGAYWTEELGGDKPKDMDPRSNAAIPAGKWVVGKLNKTDGAGTIYVDNIRIYEADKPRVEPQIDTDPVYDFEEFKYSDGKSAFYSGLASIPALLTYHKELNGNMTLRLDMAPAHSNEGWALVEMLENGSVNRVRQFDVAYTEGATTLNYSSGTYTIHTDEKSGLPYIEISAIKCFIVPNAYAEAAAGSGNVGAPTTYAHGVYSYENQKYVVFAEDLFIEEGSIGIVESQFAGYQYVDGEGATQSGGWLQLFHLYMETGLLTGQGGKDMGVKLDLGKWNNVKVVGDLEDGVFYIYVNGMLARTYDCGKDNLILGANADWIFAKVQRHTDLKKGPYHGGLLIDNVSIGVEEYVYSDSYGKQFLTDELFENYTADLLSVVDAASIRFKAPCGLRFGSIVNTEKVELLKKLYGAENTKMGTIITPADYVTDEYEDLDSLQGITREDLDAIEAGNSAGIAYRDIAFDGTYFQGDAAVNLEEGADYMVGSLVGLLTSNYERKFAGMGYIEFETENGVIGIYTDMTLRSVYAVADECYVSGAELTDEQIMILECYLMGDELPEEYMPEVEE